MKLGKLEKILVNSRKHAQRNERALERLLARINLEGIKKALEIGCGVGFLASHLTNKYGMNVTGTDVDPDQIEFAKEHNGENKNLRFFPADATKLPFENTAFDLVLSFKVIHHIKNWDKALVEVNRVLRPNGFYVFDDFACSDLMFRYLRRFVKYRGVYRLEDIARFLKQRNFEVAHQEKPRGILMERHSIVYKKN